MAFDIPITLLMETVRNLKGENEDFGVKRELQECPPLCIIETCGTCVCTQPMASWQRQTPGPQADMRSRDRTSWPLWHLDWRKWTKRLSRIWRRQHLLESVVEKREEKQHQIQVNPRKREKQDTHQNSMRKAADSNRQRDKELHPAKICERSIYPENPEREDGNIG